MESITTRAVLAEELPILAALKLLVEKQSMPFITRVLRTPTEELAFLTETSKRCAITVAVLGSHIIGFTAMNGDYMEQLFVLPDYQGKGVGSMLLGQEQKSRKYMHLAVIRANVNAIKFYTSHGFVFTHDEPNSNAARYVWKRE
jgi:ribosomal protein S18 acetylase RimI-like enzyme